MRRRSAQDEEFDIIIVGAGTAGCVLAARLTEQRGLSVLLLEVGGRDWNPMLHVPMGTGKLLRRGLHGWKLTTEPAPGADGRRIFWPRGKVLGGSSSINGMVYLRGFPQEYDMWEQAGAEGWSYQDVLPYFLRAEGHADRRDPWHGAGGPHRVRRAGSDNPLYAAFVAAGLSAGFGSTDDFNGPDSEGFGRYDFTIHDGRRSSTASAWLRPALRRPNLTLVTGATVEQVLIEEGEAVGVVYRKGGQHVARARREVVLCAGVIGSPHLLQLSGLGAPDELRRAGIAPVRPLPGVGRNLQDHVCVALRFAARDAHTMHRLIRIDRAALAMARALAFRDGPATEFPVEAGGFTRSRPNLELPDLQWYFNLGLDVSRLRVPGIWPWRPGPLDREGFSILAALQRPQSRGRVETRSPDPLVPPALFAGYLDDERDLAALRAGVGQVRRVAAQPALAAHIESELVPGDLVADDAEIDAWVRASVANTHHMAGTCRMGDGPDAVVDSRLGVHGVGRLRVADASVMPVITSGGTYAPTVMIAERCADFMLGRSPLPPDRLTAGPQRATADAFAQPLENHTC
jgi:choline dehydrogenase